MSEENQQPAFGENVDDNPVNEARQTAHMCCCEYGTRVAVTVRVDHTDGFALQCCKCKVVFGAQILKTKCGKICFCILFADCYNCLYHTGFKKSYSETV